MVNETNDAIIAAMETALKRLGGKPTNALHGRRRLLDIEWCARLAKEKEIVHTITMMHAALAEKMISFIKNRLVQSIREEEALKIGQDKKIKWYDVMAAVVKKYNEKHVSRTTKMTPNEAAEPESKAKVKMNLESVRRSSNPQPRLEVGDKVSVIVKKKKSKSRISQITPKSSTRWKSGRNRILSKKKRKERVCSTHKLNASSGIRIRSSRIIKRAS